MIVVNCSSLTTIKNYTTLKQAPMIYAHISGLTTIKNYTTLKLTRVNRYCDKV